METMICRQCGIPKPLNAFGVSRNICTACTSLKYRLRLRFQFLEMYGKICNCCGQSDPRFLTLDHVNNDGASHRETLSSDTMPALSEAVKKHRPDLYQILCYNCNMGRAVNKGLCPHKDLSLQEYLDKVTEISKRLNTKRDPSVTPVQAKAEYDKERKLKKLLSFMKPEELEAVLVSRKGDTR